MRELIVMDEPAVRSSGGLQGQVGNVCRNCALSEGYAGTALCLCGLSSRSKMGRVEGWYVLHGEEQRVEGGLTGANYLGKWENYVYNQLRGTLVEEAI